MMQAAQDLAGGQGIQVADGAQCGVVHRTGFRCQQQRLGFIAREVQMAELLQPAQLRLTQQLVQKVDGGELVFQLMAAEHRRGQPQLLQQAAHGADTAALGFGQLQVIQHRGDDRVAQQRTHLA